MTAKKNKTTGLGGYRPGPLFLSEKRGFSVFADKRPNILPGHFGFYLKVTAHRGGNAAKSCNGAKVYARLYLSAKGQEGDILARVVCAARIGRVAAMVGCDDKHIVFPQEGKQLRQRLVKRGSRGGIAVHIAPVAVQHVKIYQVHKGKAVEIFLRQAKQHLLALGVARGGDGPRDALPGKDVIDF